MTTTGYAPEVRARLDTDAADIVSRYPQARSALLPITQQPPRAIWTIILLPPPMFLPIAFALPRTETIWTSSASITWKRAMPPR